MAEEETCPVCGTFGDHLEGRPQIPDLDQDYRLHLVIEAEARQARDEHGVLLSEQMLCWLRLHGVDSRLEHLQWERWFAEIQGVRVKIREEQDEALAKRRSDEDPED